MPTYDYRCNNCEHVFELFHSINAEPHQDCPKCGSNGSVQRLISAGNGLIFKGSGFYITDYKNNSSKNSSKNCSEKKPEPKKSKEKTASKPETKKSE